MPYIGAFPGVGDIDGLRAVRQVTRHIDKCAIHSTRLFQMILRDVEVISGSDVKNGVNMLTSRLT